MKRVTTKSVLKGFVVTTVAVIGLQGIAFAAAKQSTPAADGHYALVQDAGKNVSSDAQAAPVQVALRIRINTACDDTGLPCRPPRG